MRGPAFARPTTEQPEARLGRGVVVAPYAIVYAGAEIGEDTQICPYAHIREGVRIGKRCVIGCGVRIGFDAVIGDDVQIMDDTHISGGTVIGNNCFISVQVLAVNDDKPRGYEWKGITPVTIGSNVVVGAGARLRPGIRIGDDATIAMGAIVTRDVPAGAMVKGEPARVVGRSREIGHAALEYVTEDDLIAGLPRQVYPEGIESVG
jgi:acetyltransferase-like isoleucine patch superfamily enzyme